VGAETGMCPILLISRYQSAQRSSKLWLLSAVRFFSSMLTIFPLYCRARNGRAPNGTVTLRRSSTTPFNQSQSATGAPPAQTPAEESSIHLTSPGGMPEGSYRYSREDLLEIWRQTSGATQHVDVTSLFMSTWSPGQVNGHSGRSWMKSGDVPQDPGVCWDASGKTKPIGLQDMSEEEREVCTREWP